MKKMLIISVVGTIVLTACKKDWTCECTLNGTVFGSEVIQDKSKKDARSECESNNGSAMGYTVSCSIKE